LVVLGDPYLVFGRFPENGRVLYLETPVSMVVLGAERGAADRTGVGPRAVKGQVTPRDSSATDGHRLVTERASPLSGVAADERRLGTDEFVAALLSTGTEDLRREGSGWRREV
jgi:hypothetical protein